MAQEPAGAGRAVEEAAQEQLVVPLVQAAALLGRRQDYVSLTRLILSLLLLSLLIVVVVVVVVVVVSCYTHILGNHLSNATCLIRPRLSNLSNTTCLTLRVLYGGTTCLTLLV